MDNKKPVGTSEHSPVDKAQQAEIDRLNAELAEFLDALITVKKDCIHNDESWLEQSTLNKLEEALANTTTDWLKQHDANLIAEAKQEQKEKDAGICDVIEMNGRGAKACSDAIRNQSEVSDPADLKRCCDVVDCTCSLDD